uniref:Uncharacterized protein n=1 Tax=Salmonella sp. TaxID=599 RepID=A0A482ETK5_SALSP|nr:hypothetical protein [Salmonella sp.]QBM91441.1 hypothetical protein NNIBIDOC_00111 [Salmonella sp.]
MMNGDLQAQTDWFATGVDIIATDWEALMCRTTKLSTQQATNIDGLSLTCGIIDITMPRTDNGPYKSA